MVSLGLISGLAYAQQASSPANSSSVAPEVEYAREPLRQALSKEELLAPVPPRPLTETEKRTRISLQQSAYDNGERVTMTPEEWALHDKIIRANEIIRANNSFRGMDINNNQRQQR
jgi:hypothetical protein